MGVWRKRESTAEDLNLLPRFTRAGMVEVPRHRLPDHEMLPQTAYQIVLDEVMLDGNARFNLATFVTTWMDEEADRLYAATFDKNMIDKDEYPQTAEIESRCVRMLADLWHAPKASESVGTSTTGSSEGCMLAGLALKRRWQQARREAGKPTDRPNIVMGANVQVVWEKFANYWEVEPRYVPLEGNVFHLTADRLLDHVDENTIGVVAVLGSTMDGSYEPVQEICAALDEFETTGGISVPVHVDAASGGFVAPFVQPDLVWDFRLPRVVSIQASGHKFGLVYPGVGWVLWRDTVHLPEDLVFHVNYLGGDMPTFALNFSRPGAQVVLQYFQFLRLGREVPPRPADLPGRGRPRRPGPRGDAGVRRGVRRTGAPGGHLLGERRGHEVRRVRRLPEAARTRLARAGVHDASEAGRPGGPPGRGPQRLQPRHGRAVPEGPARGGRLARQPRRADAARGAAQQLPPLRGSLMVAAVLPSRKLLVDIRRRLVYFLAAGAFVVLLAGSGFAALEDRAVANYWEGIWWALSLMTTVGFIGEAPETVGGQVLSSVLMVSGFALMALVTAGISSLFVREELPDVEAEEAFETQALRLLADLSGRLARLEEAVAAAGTNDPGDPQS